jgi:hypothetical protein
MTSNYFYFRSMCRCCTRSGRAPVRLDDLHASAHHGASPPQVLHTIWPRAGPALRGDEPCCTPSTPAATAAAAAAAATAAAATAAAASAEARAVLGTASEAANASVAVTGFGFDVFGASTLATARCKFGTVITQVISIELSGIALPRAPPAPPPPPEPPHSSADDGASSAGSSTAANTGTSNACMHRQGALSTCSSPTLPRTLIRYEHACIWHSRRLPTGHERRR